MGTTTTSTAAEEEDEIAALVASRSAVLSVLRSATDESSRLSTSGHGLLALRCGPLLPSAYSAAASLRSLAISTRSLHSRINRALAPSLPLLRAFALVDTLHHRLLTFDSPSLLPYLDLVDRLGPAIAASAEGCGPAVRRLQEAVEFIARTKAADRPRRRRLAAAQAALAAIYESELDSMRFEGPLDDALLRLQDRYEALLLRLKHPHSPAAAADQSDGPDQIEDSNRVQSLLGSEEEVEVLRRISETLAANDCVDICIDIFVKVRYRRAAKALMRLNPAYLKTYTPEEIDGMEWEALEAAIVKWIRHLENAVASVLAAERHLCRCALGNIMGGAVWPECFAKISDRIMAVFFRFGEGVACGSKEPQRLFKLLDMLGALDRLRPRFDAVFDGEAAADIRTRYRELQKLLVHAASRVLCELGLQIEGQSDASYSDVAVLNIVRYAINFLKCLAGGGYAALMGRVLRTERAWKGGDAARSEPDEESELLKDSLLNTLEALHRNVEARRSAYSRDDDAAGAAAHLIAMNSYWYMYMRTKGSELAKLVGEEIIKERYKTAAEEAAWAYQDATWGPLVRMLQAKEEETTAAGAEELDEYPKNVAREKAEAFLRGLDEMIRKHPATELSIPDGDLREQIKESTTRMVVGAYAAFLHANSGGRQEREFLPPDSIRRLMWGLFDRRRGDGGRGGDGSYIQKAAVSVAAADEKRGRNWRRRESKDWGGEAQN